MAYTDRLNDAGVEPSFGSAGDSYDNALAETINGLYKTELVHNLAPWKSLQALELATLNGFPMTRLFWSVLSLYRNSFG